jgi:hypothetical protein
MNVPYAVMTSWKDVSVHALTCFRREFQIYFPPALLASTFAYLCVYLLQTIREKLVIKHSFESAMEPARFVVPRLFFALGRTLVWSIEWWVVWLIFGLVVASFALRMLLKRQSKDATIGVGEAFRIVLTRRLGDLMGLSGLAGLGTALFSVFLLPLLLRPLALLLFAPQLFDYYPSIFKWATVALTAIVAALLNKMIFAAPELVFDQNISIGQAIRNSIRETAGLEVFFLVEFGVLGLVGGTLYFTGADFLEGSSKHGQLTLSGYELMLAAFTVLLASLALTLLSISQSLVYVSLRRDTSPSLVKVEEWEL